MPGNGRIFVSHVHEDNARAQPLLATLDAWNVDYWFDTQQLDAGNSISERVQQALVERDIFLLIATAATDRSLWTGLELQAFRGLMEQDRQAGRAGRRQIIYLVLDSAFQRPQLRPREVLVDAEGEPRLWLKQLRSALGLKPPTRALSRRVVLTAGGVAAAALAVSATAGGFALVARANKQPAPVIPSAHQPTPTPLENASRLRWFFTVDTSPNAFGVSGSTVYVGGFDGFYALDAASGAIKWHTVQLSPASSAPASILPITGDVIYVPASGGLGASTYGAINSADGTIRWNAPLGVDTVALSPPCVTSTAIYVNANNLNDGRVYALRSSDGALLWQTKIADKNLDALSAPTSVGDLIVAGSDDGALYALEAQSGAIRWRYQTIGKIQSSPAIADGLIYVGSSDTYLHAVDVASGTARWKAKTDEAVNSSPTVANGVVYVGSEDSYLYALNAATGAQIWKTQAGVADASGFVNGDLIDTQPAVGSNAIYVTAGDFNASLYAFELATGKLLWRYETVDDMSSSATVANGVVYFCGGSESHALYAVTA